jgi:hypothetical protein
MAAPITTRAIDWVEVFIRLTQSERLIFHRFLITEDTVPILLGELTERQQRFLSLHYGLEGECKTFPEIAPLLDVSLWRLRQIHDQIKKQVAWKLDSMGDLVSIELLQFFTRKLISKLPANLSHLPEEVIESLKKETSGETTRHIWLDKENVDRLERVLNKPEQ